ncbi:hypothetical protein [Phenylobacterium aquaticum]|uniref:hypothetical protein n=1 Tax=Phenylobacterium aquaticum TaxID=1763816 RepID=UPI001F5C96F0|nr:hypothetical protein [Phenylobacterium aquaticum]MCI3132290.1 hypothetical protein [Phenylobacterium aquaticum]
MFRIVCAVLAVILGINALAQLFAPFWWYGAVPGVTATGAYNPHFVRDIGAAYLAVTLGLGWFAWRPVQGWPALVAGALFLSVHAAIHVFDASCSASGWHDVLRDLPGVYLPALAAGWIAFARKPA